MGLHEKRSRAGKKGLLRRWGTPDTSTADSSEVPTDENFPSSTEDTVDALIADPDPTVAARLREYQSIVGAPQDWSDARTLEQVRAEIIKTAHNALDLQSARGRLVERKELDLMAAKIRDAWWREAQLISSAVLTALSGLPLETRSQVKAAIEAEVGAAATRVKTELVA